MTESLTDGLRKVQKALEHAKANLPLPSLDASTFTAPRKVSEALALLPSLITRAQALEAGQVQVDEEELYSQFYRFMHNDRLSQRDAFYKAIRPYLRHLTPKEHADV